MQKKKNYCNDLAKPNNNKSSFSNHNFVNRCNRKKITDQFGFLGNAENVELKKEKIRSKPKSILFLSENRKKEFFGDKKEFFGDHDRDKREIFMIA